MTGVEATGGGQSNEGVGIIMLDNSLTRPVGDIGNRDSYHYPVALAVTSGARNSQVVEFGAAGLCDHFVDTARQLEQSGVSAVASSCGFLSIYQHPLAAAVSIPVATSSLLQIPLILSLLRPDERLCVLTANATTLSIAHLDAVGVSESHRQRLLLVGFQDTQHLYPALVDEKFALDPTVAEHEIVALAEQAVERFPNIGAFLLECTNLPPYADAIGVATEKPVWDALTLIDWLHAGSRRAHLPRSSIC
ncbi:hypothetical protein QM797_02945 [Rhodococcus sp. IEGM 1381]|uniref:hypothetical protein n=1 Tax=Rhodococcus sp. IEGM 1381 TaxID=3047085 RepID=UPI0024B670C3|nr:hypothetical protein [Rhodococcus sp. IEGM 1381]MDI9893671.1 hypothetical protein [Rhodococcus sp. IEGM 1381]